MEYVNCKGAPGEELVRVKITPWLAGGELFACDKIWPGWAGPAACF